MNIVTCVTQFSARESPAAQMKPLGWESKPCHFFSHPDFVTISGFWPNKFSQSVAIPFSPFIWLKVCEKVLPKINIILSSYSIKIFCKFATINRPKHNFWLVFALLKLQLGKLYKQFCQYETFFWKLRFQIFKQLFFFREILYPNKPNINVKIIYSTFMWILNFKEFTLRTGITVQGYLILLNTKYLPQLFHGTFLVIVYIIVLLLCFLSYIDYIIIYLYIYNLSKLLSVLNMKLNNSA